MRQCRCGNELLPQKQKWCSDICQRKYHEAPYKLRKKTMNKCQHTFVKVSDSWIDINGATIPTSVVCPYCGHTRHIHEDGTIEVIRDAGRVTFKKNDE